MPRILIEIDEHDLRRIIHDYLMKTLGEVGIDEQYIKIEVKSSQIGKQSGSKQNFELSMRRWRDSESNLKVNHVQTQA